MDKVSIKYASVITIGDELLIGQVTDTNSVFIAQELNKNGLQLKRCIKVGDIKKDIINALNEESKHADIIILTGGLGPTADDITKPLLCEYFNGKMITHEPTLQHITYLFENKFKRPMIDRNRKQAEVPDVCTVLFNELGTAPGMQFNKDGKLYFSLPGVPFEMKNLFSTKVLLAIKAEFNTAAIVHKTMLVMGIGESFLADMIKDFEDSLPQNIKLAYLPNLGMIRLRLTATGLHEDELYAALQPYFLNLQNLVKEFLITDEDEPLQKVLGRLLLKNNATLSTAESCTGGYIAHLLTALPGASKYYYGSIVSYDNSIKENVLHVSSGTLKTFGAVSEQTVTEMARGILQAMHTDYAIAVSGIMGPDGGTDEKPVGLVWIAVAHKSGTIKTQSFNFRFSRQLNIELTATNALNFLRKFILNNNKN